MNTEFYRNMLAEYQAALKIMLTCAIQSESMIQFYNGKIAEYKMRLEKGLKNG